MAAPKPFHAENNTALSQPYGQKNAESPFSPYRVHNVQGRPSGQPRRQRIESSRQFRPRARIPDARQTRDTSARQRFFPETRM